MVVEELFIWVCNGIFIIFLGWTLYSGKKKDSNPKEYRKQDPIPFDEIP